MGRGNCCVNGEYEGLYFVDNDFLHVYENEDNDEPVLMGELSYSQLASGDWSFSEVLTDIRYEDTLANFIQRIQHKFKSFRPCDKWVSREEHAILENALFYIVTEDNEWSIAFKLLQKEDPYDDHLSGLQKRHFQLYLDGMRDALFEDFPSLGIYKCAWTHGVISREDFKKSA